jgi:inosine/xanthosine triphosphate pyrophosphatase family protein
LVYVTSSKHKQEENKVFVDFCQLDDGSQVKDVVEFEIREEPVLQILEVDIAKMVREGVAKAYSQIRVPCIVEYAGLIFAKYETLSYPGGLTKAMWNALGENFIAETSSSGERAIARAVIGYCDGKRVHTFTGETTGKLASSPRGSRQFYWDTVFMPDNADGSEGSETYSEIVADVGRGLPYKMQHLSQSAKAMRSLIAYIQMNPESGLWR